MLINFCKQQLLLAKINHVIYFSQSQLLLAKTNEHQTTRRKTPLLRAIAISAGLFVEKSLRWTTVIFNRMNYLCNVLFVQHGHIYSLLLSVFRKTM